MPIHSAAINKRLRHEAMHLHIALIVERGARIVFRPQQRAAAVYRHSAFYLHRVRGQHRQLYLERLDSGSIHLHHHGIHAQRLPLHRGIVKRHGSISRIFGKRDYSLLMQLRRHPCRPHEEGGKTQREARHDPVPPKDERQDCRHQGEQHKPHYATLHRHIIRRDDATQKGQHETRHPAELTFRIAHHNAIKIKFPVTSGQSSDALPISRCLSPHFVSHTTNHTKATTVTTPPSA